MATASIFLQRSCLTFARDRSMRIPSTQTSSLTDVLASGLYRHDMPALSTKPAYHKQHCVRQRVRCGELLRDKAEAHFPDCNVSVRVVSARFSIRHNQYQSFLLFASSGCPAVDLGSSSVHHEHARIPPLPCRRLRGRKKGGKKRENKNE